MNRLVVSVVVGAVLWSGAACTGGQKGDVGPRGPAGERGEPGPQGPPGIQGAPGAVGADGPIGPEGPVGATGATGPQGATGDEGKAGGVRVFRADGGFAGLLMGPDAFWSADYECFMPPNGGQPPIAASTVLSGSNCTGPAYISPSTTSEDGLSLLHRCFFVRNGDAGTTLVFGRLHRPAQRFYGVAAQWATSSGCFFSTLPSPAYLYSFEPLPIDGGLISFPIDEWSLQTP